MNSLALMFGPASRQLFGIFHPAEESGSAETAVLVCPPYGAEGLRTHRFFKVLAERLARTGVATLRFDFHGAGDSPGDESEGEFDGWRRDLGWAHGGAVPRAPSTGRAASLRTRPGARRPVNRRCRRSRSAAWRCRRAPGARPAP